MRNVVVDANVLVSFFVDRHPAQRDAADALLQQADAGEITAIVPQFILFEVTYVLQSQYGYAGERLASLIRAIIAFPGVQLIDDCPWKAVMEIWPDRLASLTDAALGAVALSNRYDAVATFDRKLSKRMQELGAAAYW
ncbi:MAG: PIN domain-containing protein [Acidobacteria bacterium]|nr:PIN domain-containing protein [Acidobacteriota bacterium]MBV9070216.1 PIN domain-containing protein [Acidobacteriota bacterium]MBV9184925.1 PIN domain-containing protein [Acidobacteriota bacterium]